MMKDTLHVDRSDAINRSNYWDSVSGEHDIEIREIVGKLPADLIGTLYRNGSGRWHVGPSQVDSLFDADGMISAFALDGKGVRFRNRFVRTKHYVRATRAGRLIDRGFTHQRPGGILANIGRRPANTANTNVLVDEHRLLALWEAGRPHELDLDTLETIGICDLAGVLRGPLGAYSAHSTADPVARTRVNFGLDPFYPRLDVGWVLRAKDPAERLRRLREQIGEAVPRLRLRLYETDRSGATSYLRSVRLPGMCMIHDMALTRRYAVFVASPFRLSPWPLLGHKSYWEGVYFKKDAPAWFILAPRDGGPVRMVETDPFYMWHFTNAYDDGPDVVVELPRSAPEAFDAMWSWSRQAGQEPPGIREYEAFLGQIDAGTLTRFRIAASGRVSREPLADFVCELPQFDQRRSTRRHSVSYVATYTHGESLGDGIGIARVDHRTGSAQVYAPRGHDLVEPTFVPKAPGAAEDDGWILTVGHDKATHRSRLMVFDAARLDSGPVAEAWLPFHLPMSYHGVFTDRVAGCGGRPSSAG